MAHTEFVQLLVNANIRGEHRFTSFTRRCSNVIEKREQSLCNWLDKRKGRDKYWWLPGVKNVRVLTSPTGKKAGRLGRFGVSNSGSTGSKQLQLAPHRCLWNSSAAFYSLHLSFCHAFFCVFFFLAQTKTSDFEAFPTQTRLVGAAPRKRGERGCLHFGGCGCNLSLVFWKMWMLHCAVHVLHTVCFLSEITHVSETEALCYTLEHHLNSLGVTVLLPTSFFSPSLIIFLAPHSHHRRTTKWAGYQACLSPPVRRESWHLAQFTV